MNKNPDTRFLGETHDANIAVTGERRVIYWSRGAEIIFGFASAETKDRDLAASDRLVFDLYDEYMRTPKSGALG